MTYNFNVILSLKTVMPDTLGHVEWELRTTSMQFLLQLETWKIYFFLLKTFFCFEYSLISDRKISFESKCRPGLSTIRVNEISEQGSDYYQRFYLSAHKCARCLKTTSNQSLKWFHRSLLHLEHSRAKKWRKRTFVSLVWETVTVANWTQCEHE